MHYTKALIIIAFLAMATIAVMAGWKVGNSAIPNDSINLYPACHQHAVQMLKQEEK